MVRKRLEKGVSDKLAIVEGLIKLAQSYNVPVLRVGDIYISIIPKATPQTISSGTPFTKSTNKSKLEEPKDQLSAEALDAVLFGTSTDYSNV